MTIDQDIILLNWENGNMVFSYLYMWWIKIFFHIFTDPLCQFCFKALTKEKETQLHDKVFSNFLKI